MGRVRAAVMRCVLFATAGVLIASCAGTPPPPPPPPPAPKPVTFWPTNGWQTSTPEAQGIDSGWLAYAVETIRYRHLPVHSLLIERHGKIVLDAYFQPFGDNQLHDVASVTKSVISTLVGIAQAKQQVAADLNAPVMPILAQGQNTADARKARLSLANLLSMTSGLDCSARDGQNFLEQMVSSPHWTNFALQRDEVAEPGTAFNYCAVNMELVSAVLTRQTGTSAADLAQRELFGPLGIRSFYWPTDGDGISHGYADLRLQPRDMAKLGYLWLHHGVWEDRQLVPGSYLDEAMSPHANVSANVKYGYGLWLYPNGRAGCPADFEANGNGGQRIAVIPSKDMVVVITGAGLNADDVMSLAAPAWRWTNPLMPNPQANARLSADLARSAAPSDVLMAATSARPISTTPVSVASASPAPASTASVSTVPASNAPIAYPTPAAVPSTPAVTTAVPTAPVVTAAATSAPPVSPAPAAVSTAAAAMASATTAPTMSPPAPTAVPNAPTETALATSAPTVSSTPPANTTPVATAPTTTAPASDSAMSPAPPVEGPALSTTAPAATAPASTATTASTVPAANPAAPSASHS